MQCSLLELKKHRNKCSAMLQLPYSTESWKFSQISTFGQEIFKWCTKAVDLIVLDTGKRFCGADEKRRTQNIKGNRLYQLYEIQPFLDSQNSSFGPSCHKVWFTDHPKTIK